MSGYARLPGIGSHHSARRQTDEWLTPKYIIDALGPFDLDPCAPAMQPWPTAALTYTVAQDGLAQPWSGRVWLNPPYSTIEPWMARLAEHGNGTALVFARTETRWWHQHVWPRAVAVLFLRGRLSFVRADGAQNAPTRQGSSNAGAPSALVAYSDCDADRLIRSGIPGAFVQEIAI